jgi:hypothetical protein
MTDTTRLRLPHFLVALAVLYLAGVVLALSDDLASLGDAIANGSRVNAPLPIIAAQLLGGFVALRCAGPKRIAGAGLLLAACTVSLAAAAFDGDLGHGGLSGVEIAYQCVIVTVTASTWLMAVGRLRRSTSASRMSSGFPDVR